MAIIMCGWCQKFEPAGNTHKEVIDAYEKICKHERTCLERIEQEAGN